jgi:hypothetical protein
VILDRDKRIVTSWWFTTIGGTAAGFLFALSPSAASLLGVLAFAVVFPLTIMTAMKASREGRTITETGGNDETSNQS